MEDCLYSHSETIEQQQQEGVKAPKEKADELITLFRYHAELHDKDGNFSERVLLKYAKIGVLVAIDEIIGNKDPYWNEVKKMVSEVK